MTEITPLFNRFFASFVKSCPFPTSVEIVGGTFTPKEFKLIAGACPDLKVHSRPRKEKILADPLGWTFFRRKTAHSITRQLVGNTTLTTEQPMKTEEDIKNGNTPEILGVSVVTSGTPDWEQEPDSGVDPNLAAKWQSTCGLSRAEEIDPINGMREQTSFF